MNPQPIVRNPIHAAALTLAAMLLAASLAARGEKPQLLVSKGKLTINMLQHDSALLERTLNQGESDRISY